LTRGAVERAIITHGHSDHARSGHDYVLATKETLGAMELRLGSAARRGTQALAYGETLKIGDVTVKLVPAGHVLGSAQVVIDYKGARAVISGDYKRASDPTCAPFELVPCDLFVTEATFALPVFRHGDARQEIAKAGSRSLSPSAPMWSAPMGSAIAARIALREAGMSGDLSVAPLPDAAHSMNLE
jgi:putative mRNA 3-end processing factor